MKKLQDIRVLPGHHIIGEVKDGHVHVDDIIHHGVSEKMLTGDSPALHPIPVSEIEAIRKNNGMHEPVSSLA